MRRASRDNAVPFVYPASTDVDSGRALRPAAIELVAQALFLPFFSARIVIAAWA